jgi:hypothetical protein
MLKRTLKPSTGAHDEAVYFARGSGSYPPSTNWQSASAAADPPPSVEPFWATASHSLPLSDRIRLRLAFDASDITGVMSALLPSIVVVFSIGLSITAGIDLSTSLVYGFLATRRALSSTIDRGNIYARVIRYGFLKIHSPEHSTFALDPFDLRNIAIPLLVSAMARMRKTLFSARSSETINPKPKTHKPFPVEDFISRSSRWHSFDDHKFMLCAI